MRSGALCVTTCGPVWMLMWPAEIWDTHDSVRLKFIWSIAFELST